MNLIIILALAILEVVAIAFWSLLFAFTTTVKALPQNRIATSVDYSKLTIRQLRTMARGTGVKGWEKLRKAELIAALSVI